MRATAKTRTRQTKTLLLVNNMPALWPRGRLSEWHGQAATNNTVVAYVKEKYRPGADDDYILFFNHITASDDDSPTYIKYVESKRYAF